jgi:hypothetical protein
LLLTDSTGPLGTSSVKIYILWTRLVSLKYYVDH